MEEDKKEVSAADTPKVTEVAIDMTLGCYRYYGKALVSEDGKVDLSDIPCNELAQLRWDGENVCPVKVVLESYALYQAGHKDNLHQCERTRFYLPEKYLVQLADSRWICAKLTREFEGEYYFKLNGSTNTYRDSYGTTRTFWAPDSYWHHLYYCDSCGTYTEAGNYDSERNMCKHCADRYIIEDYTASHRHNAQPILYGAYPEGHFVGMGFELEVDRDDSDGPDNDDVARGLCSACGLDKHEVRFAHDGSLNYGFECISEPHTVKDFWEKAPKWRAMLKYLADAGYASHDPGTCGLHVHVSREMFGKTKETQNNAIAKVYTFFDNNWDDIVKISRRSSDGMGYCNKNTLQNECYSDPTKTLYKKWQGDTRYQRGHHLALNNANSHTFEYRLGRGTLNAWSFFAWIDFVLTVTKNAKRITVNKVDSNDLLSWLGGVTETTAKYIYKRGAFRKQMLTLYPAIEWECDLTDC